MKSTTIVVLVIILGVAGYYLFFRSPSSPNTTTNPTATTPAPITTTPAPSSQPASVSVDIAHFAFSPATLNIKVGTKVTWKNDDSVAHTVTSDSNGLLQSSTIAPGQSFSFTFDKVGTTAYHCAIHPMMKGSVVVTS